MSLATPPFPASRHFLESIRQSSRALRLNAKVIITPSSIERLLQSESFTGTFQRASASHSLALPLNFPSTLAELNILSILSLLNFGSGYSTPIHQATGRGTWDLILSFVFTLYISSLGGDADHLSAKGLRVIDDATVAEMMRINIHVERPHESIPGLIVGELGGPLRDFVSLVTGTLNQTGEVLVTSGYPDLGSFVAEALKEGRQALVQESHGADVEVILEKLVRAIPSFRDMHIVDSQPIYCFQKALFLIRTISNRFGQRSAPPFPVPSVSHLPVLADGVIPSLLVHLGIIDLSASSTLASCFPGPDLPANVNPILEAAPPKSPKSTLTPNAEGPQLTDDQAYTLRAAAIDACELIVEHAHGRSHLGPGHEWITAITLPELDTWLRTVDKERDDWKSLPRLVSKGTVYF